MTVYNESSAPELTMGRIGSFFGIALPDHYFRQHSQGIMLLRATP
jgi:hypothetical protein